jgi:hypothetical protein
VEGKDHFAQQSIGRGLTVVTPFFTLTFLTSFLSPLLPTWMPLLLLMEIVAPSLMLQ